MKKLFKKAVLLLALNMMLVQAVSLAGGMKPSSTNTRTEVAGGIDILSPDPICVVRING